MPIYDYACTSCGQVTEVIHGVYDSGPKFCPACGTEGSMRKAINAPAIHYKGSGWAKKDRSATSSPGKSRNAGTDGESGASGDAGTAGKGSDSAAKGSSTSTSPAPASSDAKPSTPAPSTSGSGD